MAKPIIEVEGLSKLYRLGLIGRTTLRDSAERWWYRMRGKKKRCYRAGKRKGMISDDDSQAGPEPNTIWALKDVSFSVQQGEIIGIIGKNGAGKSTLLKILSRITEPTLGRAILRGRSSSLLEVGTGFHPELTGRENIYLNGAILGMRKSEIERKFDEIVAFAEIDKFIGTPVKRYSSGMYVRLAFAVAAHLEPEILLVDEVLAVGDAEFQKKCLGKMDEVAKQGRTVLFISHNMAAVENLCEKSILLETGHVTRQGDSSAIIRHYLEKTLPAIVSVPLSERKDRTGNGKVQFTNFNVENDRGKCVKVLQNGEDAVFVFSYSCASGESPKNVSVGFGLFSSDGQLLFVLYGAYTGQKFKSIPSSGQFRCCIPRLPLVPGRYRVGARVTVGDEEADWPKDAIGYVEVEAGDFFGTGSLGFEGKCSFLVNGSWSVR